MASSSHSVLSNCLLDYDPELKFQERQTTKKLILRRPHSLSHVVALQFSKLKVAPEELITLWSKHGDVSSQLFQGSTTLRAMSVLSSNLY